MAVLVGDTWGTDERYSIEKIAEGGWLSQKEAIEIAKNLGATDAKRSWSPYVGQFGIQVWGGKRLHDRLEQVYYGGAYFDGRYDKWVGQITKRRVS